MGAAPSVEIRRTGPTRIISEYSFGVQPIPSPTPIQTLQKRVQPIRVGPNLPSKHTASSCSSSSSFGRPGRLSVSAECRPHTAVKRPAMRAAVKRCFNLSLISSTVNFVPTLVAQAYSDKFLSLYMACDVDAGTRSSATPTPVRSQRRRATSTPERARAAGGNSACRCGMQQQRSSVRQDAAVSVADS